MPVTTLLLMSTTKERLQLAAETLFARDGVRGARVQEITALAGQRNSSALHYHFGSVDGILQAIVGSHQESIDSRRAVMLDGIGPSPTVREVIRAVVEPLADALNTESGRNYLRILPEIIAAQAWLRLDDIVYAAPGIVRCYQILGDLLAGVSPDLRDERFRSLLLAVTTLLSARATLVHVEAEDLLDHHAFVANLVNMVTGLVEAPVEP